MATGAELDGNRPIIFPYAKNEKMLANQMAACVVSLAKNQKSSKAVQSESRNPKIKLLLPNQIAVYKIIAQSNHMSVTSLPASRKTKFLLLNKISNKWLAHW